MQAVKENASYLSKLVYESQGKKWLKKSTDEQIKILIELILNFDTFAHNECGKSVKTRVKKLQKLNWKLKTARQVLLKHFPTIRIVISAALVFMIESEICNVF
jgi:hypothetical protein